MPSKVLLLIPPAKAHLIISNKIKIVSCHLLQLFALLLLGALITFPLYAGIKIHMHLKYGIVCNSRDCLAKSKQLSKFMNKSVDPCDNFYQYACGNLSNANPFLPQQTFYRKAKALLKSKIKSTDPKHYNLIRTFYKSCINQGLFYNKIADSPLKKMAQEIQNSDWNINNTKNWLKLYEIIASYGVLPESLLQCVYFLKEQQYIRQIMKPKRLLTVTDPKKIKLYYLTIYNKTNNNNNSVSAEIQKLIKFENQLISGTTERNIFPETNMTVDIDWEQLIKIMVPNMLNDDNLDVAYEKDYFNNLQKVMEKTDALTISKYLVIRHIIFLADNFFADKLSKLQKEDKCVNITIKYLSNKFGDMYEKNYISKLSHHLMFNEVDNIKKIVIDLIANVTWLNAYDLLDLQNEVRQIKITLGHFTKNENKKFYIYSSNVKLYSNNYIKNLLNIIKISLKEFNLNRALFDAKNVNYAAEYSPEFNQIDISLSAFHHYYITNSMPYFVNYNQFGSLIGQRITLSIYKFIAQKLNSEGNIKIVTSFMDGLQCYIDDKIQYYEKDVNISESKKEKLRNTVDNDVANFGGVKAAYFAHEDFLKNNSDVFHLPETDLIEKHLYWILFAQMVCRKPIINEAISSIEYQINGPLRNFDRFGKDFNCPLGSKMNPLMKCKNII